MERPLDRQSEQRRGQERSGRSHGQIRLRKTRGCLASRPQRMAQPGCFGPYPALVGGYSDEFRVRRVPVAIPTPSESLSCVLVCTCAVLHGERSEDNLWSPFFPLSLTRGLGIKTQAARGVRQVPLLAEPPINPTPCLLRQGLPLARISNRLG